ARHGIALIDDEVICGFGRTGQWFGCQTFGFQPDSMSVAKALSSAYIPISAGARSLEFNAIIEKEGGKTGTLGRSFYSSAPPVAEGVADRTIEIYQRRDVVGHARRVAPLFNRRLTALAAHPLVGEAAGIGLIGALELVADKANKTSFAADKMVGATCARFC